MSEPRYRVVWSEAAALDLDGIATYIAVASPQNALGVLARLRGRAEALRSMPYRGRAVPELAAFGMHAWREVIVRPYRILYRIEGRDVLVLAVLDGRRDLQDVLLERLVRSARLIRPRE